MFSYTKDVRTEEGQLYVGTISDISKFSELYGSCPQQWEPIVSLKGMTRSYQQHGMFVDSHGTALTKNLIENNIVPVLKACFGDKRWPVGIL